MKDEKEQTQVADKATSNTPVTYGDYTVIPNLVITREPYTTKKNVQLWSYGVQVEFYGKTKTVGLQTPNKNSEEAVFGAEKRDKYGYQVLDAMFEVLGAVPLAIKINKRASDDSVRGVEYYAVGIENVKGVDTVIDHIQLVTQNASSESLLRSAINRLSLNGEWNLPIL